MPKRQDHDLTDFTRLPWLLPRVKNLDSHLPLHAAIRGNLSLVEADFERRYRDANMPYDRSLALLERMIGGRRVRILNLLLAHGADVNMTDKNGLTALHLAAEECTRDIVELLLMRGADPNMVSPAFISQWSPTWFRQRNFMSFRRLPYGTPLHTAAACRKADTVELLLRWGVDVNAKAPDGSTALRNALYAGDARAARVLIAAGAEKVQIKNAPDERLLHDTLQRGDPALIPLLLDNGMDVEERGAGQDTLLHIAARQGKLDLAEVLIAHRADVNAANEGGNTPLHLAVGGGHAEVASLLLDNGADVDARDNGDDTPLHSASIHGHKDMVELLLAHGADPNVRNSRGRTPLDEALRRGHDDIIRLLRAKSNSPAATGEGNDESMR